MDIKQFLPRLVLAACLTGNLFAADLPPLAAMRLSDIDRLVVERNRSLITAQRATSAAAAGLESAGGRPNPTLSLNTAGIRSKPQTGSNTLDTILRIDQPIERGGKRDLRLAVAGKLLEASRADAADSLRQQRLFARQAYYDLKAAEDKAHLSEASAGLARQVLDKALLRLTAGDLSPVDVARIRTDTLRAEGDASQAMIDWRRARLTLAQLIALEQAAPTLATADDWPHLSPLPATLPDIDARPDVIAARQRLEAAEKNIHLAKAQQIRDLTLGAQVERNAQEPNNTLLGIGLSIPLFTGYDFRGEVQRAHVDRDLAMDDLERAKATAAAEFTQFTFEAERLAERARRLRDEALPAARKASASVQFAFAQGAASALDVIDARRSLHAVETDTVNALADAAKARAAWASALNRQELP